MAYLKKNWLAMLAGVFAVGCAERTLPLPEPDAVFDGGVDLEADMGSENDDATLIDLEISQAALSPNFAPLTTRYTASEPFFVDVVTLTPTAESSTATITVNGQPVLSGTASQTIPLSAGMNPITVQVATHSGKMRRYDVIVARASSSIEYFKASNTGGSDLFGYSISLSGDTLAIGAIGESSSATGVNNPHQGNDIDGDQSGAVYVFTRSGSTWSQQAYIKASNSGSSDNLGYSVSLSGDTLAVGAPNESSSATGVNNPDQGDDYSNAYQSGAVYVFTRSGCTWSQQAYIKASHVVADNRFGELLSLSGNTLAVTGSEIPGAGSRGVYIFTRSGSTWTQQAWIKASGPSTDAYFGTALSLSGDTLAVGASDGDGFHGGVYVFIRSGSTWSQQTHIQKDFDLDPGGPRFFALQSLSLSKDYLAVGASGESDFNGAVYVFTRSGSTWSQQAHLVPPNALDSSFGFSVSLSEDTLAVGAAYDDSNATGVGGNQGNQDAYGSGAVYIFTRSGSTWSQPTYIKASNTGSDDVFGFSVSISDDTLAVGAPYESSGATGVDGNQNNGNAFDSGAVYLYSSHEGQ